MGMRNPSLFDSHVIMSSHPISCLSSFRYLASGMSQQDTARYFRMGKSTVSEMIPEVCNTLWEELASGTTGNATANCGKVAGHCWRVWGQMEFSTLFGYVFILLPNCFAVQVFSQNLIGLYSNGAGSYVCDINFKFWTISHQPDNIIHIFHAGSCIFACVCVCAVYPLWPVWPVHVLWIHYSLCDLWVQNANDWALPGWGSESVANLKLHGTQFSWKFAGFMWINRKQNTHFMISCPL